MREVRWERMFPDELERAFHACPVVYLPYGLCEPHGPHLALGLDALKAHGLACAAAQAHGGIVAPPDYWHVHEVGHFALWAEAHVGQVERTWITALPPWQHFRNVCYQIRAVDALGFHAAILLTGHYGPNWEDLKTLVELVQPRVGARLFGLPDFEANRAGFDGAGAIHRDHAGQVETSQLWALLPEAVDVSRLPPPGPPAPHFGMGPTARQADRRIGERMVAEQARWLGDQAQALLAEYDRLRPLHRLRTFEDVERLWDEVVRPALPGFRTMQDDPDPALGRTLGEDSVWRPNWRVPPRGAAR
jgi:creatinine amidohydrolase